jgi:prevent-host-death family protein
MEEVDVAGNVAEEILGITAAKSELPSRIKRLQSGQLARVLIVKNNSPVAVLVAVDEYDRISELQEEIEDILAVLAAKETDDGSRLTLAEIKARFGID